MVSMIESMGYTDRQARGALTACDNNLERYQYLLYNTELLFLSVSVCVPVSVSVSVRFSVAVSASIFYSMSLNRSHTHSYTLHSLTHTHSHTPSLSYPLSLSHSLIIFILYRALDWIFSRDNLDDAVEEVIEGKYFEFL